jgi:hypothetical protein
VLLLELAHVDDGHVLLAAVEQLGERRCRLGLADTADVPTIMNTPIGLRGSVRPARLVRIAWASASSAWSCPTTRSISLRSQHVLISSDTMRPTGMPVQLAMISATAWPSTTRVHERLFALQAAGRWHRSRRSNGLLALEAFARSSPPTTRHFRASVRVALHVGLELVAQSRSASTSSLLAFPTALEFAPAGCAAVSVLDLRRALRRGCRGRRARARTRASFGRDSARWRTLAVLERRRRRRLAQRDARAGRVEDAHRLVGELAAREVAHRQRTDSCTASSSMRTPWCFSITAASPRMISHRDGLARLLDLDDLEAARERRVLLEVLLVLGPGRRGDRAQLAARQRRLEQVGGVVLPGRPPAPIIVCASSMNRTIGCGERLDLVDDALQAVLELALHAGAGLQQRQVERAHRDVAQRRRHVALRRCAARSPSTTAVLPTPGSPVRIGLFCRRRVRMSIIWRISSSRPSTGSILPGARAAVRSIVN